jgi:hypothetical protein
LRAYSCTRPTCAARSAWDRGAERFAGIRSYRTTLELHECFTLNCGQRSQGPHGMLPVAGHPSAGPAQSNRSLAECVCYWDSLAVLLPCKPCRCDWHRYRQELVPRCMAYGIGRPRAHSVRPIAIRPRHPKRVSVLDPCLLFDALGRHRFKLSIEQFACHGESICAYASRCGACEEADIR